METSQKIEISGSNADAIERALDQICEKIPASDIDVDTVEERLFPVDLTLLDATGISKNCELTYRFFIDPNTELYRITLSITEKGTPRSVAIREYFFKSSDEAPENKSTAISFSGMQVFQMNKTGIGSTLLSKGEDIKSLTARKVAKRFGFQYLVSVIEDSSKPKLWTTDSALALGYKPVGIKYGIYECFEKEEDLSKPFEGQSLNLAKYWNENRNTLGKLKRLFVRKLAR